MENNDRVLPELPKATEQDFPIVGIGASRGGLNAFKEFLKVLPEKTGMAFVIVQHLDPDFDSILPALLSKVTKLPVNLIEDDIHLAPDNIYVIPPNKTLTTFDGVLKLTPRENLATNALIDVFFTSLAEVHQALAVGIVLTGTGSDGTLGLTAIKKFGGITFAQDKNSALAEGMPGSAVDANVVDFILPIEEIPLKLIDLFQQQKERISEISGTREKVISNKIMLLLQQHFNIDFTHYKQKTIQRRLARRIAITNQKSIEEYHTLVSTDNEELSALIKDFLIPVTSFFRDPETFEILKNEILPIVYSQKEAEKPIRIWTAGCSTGQEAYSIAMLIYEYLEENSDNRQVQIFATDVSQSAITYARKGLYTMDEISMLTELRKSKYFTRKSENSYQIIKPLRDMCVFAEHNFLKDPPFSNIDLLSCRNVLIYMEPFLQKKALTAFHYALKNKGFLLQGKSETTTHSPELFTTYNNIEKIYTANPVEKNMFHFGSDRRVQIVGNKKLLQSLNSQIDFRKVAEALLLKEYTPANVIINSQMEIVYIHGNISPFLEHPQGKVTFNLLKMAREGLSFELRSTLHKVKATGQAVVKKDIPLMIKGELIHVTIEIAPLENCMEQYYMVVFKLSEINKALSDNGNQDIRVINEYLERISYLEMELAHAREDMRSITEDQETVSEELQSSNEEMLSSNEELQSLNEELESSKEELINSNEELRNLINQLQQKNKHIEAINKYTETIMSTISQPLVVIDSDFKIRTANNAFYDQFDLNDKIIGADLFQIKNRIFDLPKLKFTIKNFDRHRPTEMDNYEFKLKILTKLVTLQLNASKFISPQNESLVLLSFFDITIRKMNEKRIKDFSTALESKVAKSNYTLSLKDRQLQQYAHTTNHEFQEPLRKLITFSHYIRRLHNEGSIGKVVEYVGKIELAAMRMSKLFNDVQDYASVKQHRKLFTHTDLNQLIKDTISDFDLLIEEKKATVNILNKLPEIMAIPFQMNQLFYDLINNSLKFVRQGIPPIITIKSTKLSKAALKKKFPMLDSKNIYHQIDIEDNGIGFDQKYALRIFTMFQRLNSAFDYPGTGIGLALCKKIVDDYNGHIYAEGIENSKAIFHVILPEIRREKE